MSPFDLAGLRAKIDSMNKQSEQSDFWDDPEKAQSLLKKKKALESTVNEYDRLSSGFKDISEMIEIAEELEDEDEAMTVVENFDELCKDAETFRLKLLLDGKYDSNSAILSIHAGTGGVDAMDWAQMLMRMYSYLRREHGVHRLVRISPFNAAGKRQTSFSSVEVMPEMDEDFNIEINPQDLRIDTYRSTGAGGQHVNTTDSAIRITHLPTNIVVTCQNERSQHQNREVAMRILASKLAELAEREHKENLAELKGDFSQITWGSQIRSYVFQPYTMVKDHRTGAEVGNVASVMDGDIDYFINEELKARI